MDNFVITIARGYGSGGKEIGTAVAEKLGILCYDSEILKMASEKSGILEDYFKEYDEKTKKRMMKRSVYEWALGKTDMNSNNGVVDGWKIFQVQSEVIRELAQTESCVIIGKCAASILEGYKNVLNIYIEAPRWACLKRLTERNGWSAEKANSTLIVTEKQRSEYYRCYTGGKDWANPMNYDMTINSANWSKEKCVELITQALDLKVKKDEE